MKILYITNHLSGTDGWGRYGQTLIEEVARRGHEVVVLAHNDSARPPGLTVFKILGSHMNYLANPITAFFSAKHASPFIAAFKPDCIHFIVEPYVSMLPFLRIPPGVPVFLTIHGSFSYPPNILKNKLKKIICTKLFSASLSKLSGIIAVSSFTKQYFLSALPKSQKFTPKVSVIPNGVLLPGQGIELKKNSEISKILFVGAIKPRKGLKEALLALAEYRRRFQKSFIFKIVGLFDSADKYYQELVTLIHELNLSDSVHFTGKVSDLDLRKEYEQADLFLLLPVMQGNKFEGFGLVYLEANAMGVPVIGGRNSGATEAIMEGKSGFLVDPGNAGEVAIAIDKILNQNAIKKEDCLIWAKSHSIGEVANEVLDLYGQHV